MVLLESFAGGVAWTRLSVGVPTAIICPLSVVTTFPGWVGSFQSTAYPTARLSWLQSLLCVVHCHDP